MLANILQKPLGLPDWTGFVLPILGALLVWRGAVLLRRAKNRGEITPAQPTLQQYRRRFWLFIILVMLASLSLPFYAPYTGITLAFPQLVICAVISCVFCVAIVTLSMRRYRRRRRSSGSR